MSFSRGFGRVSSGKAKTDCQSLHCLNSTGVMDGIPRGDGKSERDERRTTTGTSWHDEPTRAVCIYQFAPDWLDVSLLRWLLGPSLSTECVHVYTVDVLRFKIKEYSWNITIKQYVSLNDYFYIFGVWSVVDSVHQIILLGLRFGNSTRQSTTI